MSRVLIVEDELAIAELEKDYLELSSFEVEIETDGEKGLKLGLTEDFDMIILDIMLPGVDGFEICKQIREKKDIPILMVSAKKEDIDKIRGLGLGADDYITKPFSPRELLARVNAHLKRQNRKQEKRLSVGDLSMDMKRREAYIGERMMTLTKKEFDLLEYFIQNKDIVLSRDSILNDIWGFDYDGDTRIVDVHVFKLRNKLNASHVHIRSSRGVGYLLEEVHETQ